MNHNPIPYLLNPMETGPLERRQAPGPDKAQGRLAELREMPDHDITDDGLDVRGWEVKTAASFGDRAVGTVDDLIVDRSALRIRYLLVCLSKDAVATTRDRRILVPVGVARMDETENQVRLDGYSSAYLVGVPEFRPGKLTRHFESAVWRRFAWPEPKAGPRRRRVTDFYEHDEFDDRAFWTSRRRGREHIPYIRRVAGGQ